MCDVFGAILHSLVSSMWCDDRHIDDSIGKDDELNHTTKNCIIMPKRCN